MTIYVSSSVTVKIDEYVKFLMDFAKKNDIDAGLDAKGNVYFTKGLVAEGKFYPCVCAHLDTVQDNQLIWINENKRLEIKIDEYLGKHYLSCEGFGLGGDDKAVPALHYIVQLLIDRPGRSQIAVDVDVS